MFLVLATDCNPEWASLPSVGYNMCRALSEHAEVVVATHVRNRDSILRHGVGNARVVFIDNEYIAAPMYKAATILCARGDPLRGRLISPWRIRHSWRLIGKYGNGFKHELRRGEFDVVHRVTPMSPTLPSPMASWSPVPFVIGPLNGGLKWPRAFHNELKREREWLSHLRRGCRVLPYYRATYRRAAAILAGFRHTVHDIPRRAQDRVINFPEVGIDPSRFFAAGPREDRDQITFLFVGRLVPYKCPDVLVSAFASSAVLRQHRLCVVGDGPMRSLLEQMIQKHDLHACVELLGSRSQAEVGEIMRQADVFAFPSIRELGAGVVVEALASGLPCVVVDYGGPGELVDNTRGVKIPLGTKSELVGHFTREMEALAAARDRRRQLGSVARRYALDVFSWSNKAARVVQIYEWVLGLRGKRPEFQDECICKVENDPVTAGEHAT